MTEKPENAGDLADEITEDAYLMAARVRALADSVPTAEELAAIAAAALAEQPPDKTAAEIRRLAVTAFTVSQRAAYLLGKLAGLLNDEAGERSV